MSLRFNNKSWSLDRPWFNKSYSDMEDDQTFYVLHRLAGRSLIKESLEYGSSVLSYTVGDFIFPRMKGLYAVHAKDLPRIRKLYKGPIYEVTLSKQTQFFSATDNVLLSAANKVMAEARGRFSGELFDLRAYYQTLITEMNNQYTESEFMSFLPNIRASLIEMMGGGDYGEFDEAYFRVLGVEEDFVEVEFYDEYETQKVLNSGYLPALAAYLVNGSPYDFGFDISEGYGYEMKRAWENSVETWVQNLEKLMREYKSERYLEDDLRTFEDFLRNQGDIPSELVVDAWTSATDAAGVVYVDNDILVDEGEDPLKIFLFLNEDVIQRSQPVLGVTPKTPDDLRVTYLSSREEIREYLQSFSETPVPLELQVLQLEYDTGIGNFPKHTKRIVGAYFHESKLIAVAWATSEAALDQMKGDTGSVEFDILIDPSFQGLGLGKSLLCDAVSHLLDISKDYTDSVSIEINVVSPILRRYLKRMGFTWQGHVRTLSNTVIMRLSLSDTDQIVAMCAELERQS